MSGLIPFNLRNNSLTRSGAGFEDFYNMLDDFFGDAVLPGRSLSRDTFKIDIAEKDNEYIIEAEMPGINREEIDLSIDRENLCISVNRSEQTDKTENSYIHKERRYTAMTRRVRLADSRLDEISAKLENGVLFINVPKQSEKNTSRKINIA